MALTARNKWMRGIGIAVLVLVLAAGGLHLYFSRNAARYLESVVASQSGGKLQLKVKGFSFNYFTGYIEVRNGSLLSLDTVSKPATYNIRLQKLSLHLQSFWPLLFQRRLLLDSVKVHSPEVTIYRWRKDPALAQTREQVSLPSELGRLYQSLLEGLDAMELKRITIENGAFTLYNKIDPAQQPLRLTGVDFSLLYPNAGTTGGWKDPKAQRNVWLNIPAQAFNLPDGRHRLAFSRVHLELFRQRLELDSCTISTIDTAAGKTRFDLFFKQLLLTGVDFDALYRLNKLKADSVYCYDPTFQIEVVRQQQKRADTSQRQRPQQVVADLDTDLELAYVGVRSAGFNIFFNGTKKRTLSNAQRDDFSMRGLRLKSDSTQPFTVRQFDMKVRGYELYNEDSTAAFKFDSVQIRNNRVTLRQFSAVTLYKPDQRKNDIRYQVPLFELEGLDWYALIFEEKLQAARAYLYNPDIYYKGNKPVVSRRRQPLFDVLHNAGDLLSLQRVEVRNGRLHLLPNARTEVRLEGANLTLESDSLLKATSQAGIKSSVGGLSFIRGTIKAGTTTLALDGMRYSDTGSVLANNFMLSTPALMAKLQGVALNDAVFNQDDAELSITGLQWAKGLLEIKDAAAKAGPKKSATGMMLEGIRGRNTTVRINKKNLKLQTFLPLFGAAQVGRTAEGAMVAEGIFFGSDGLRVQAGAINATTGAYRMSGGDFSIQNIALQQIAGQDSLTVRMASLSGEANVSSLMNGEPHLLQLSIQQPQWVWRKHQRQKDSTSIVAKPLPKVRIDALSIEEPKLDFVFYKDTATQRLLVLPTDDAFIRLQGVRTDDKFVYAQRFALRSGPLRFTGPDGKVLGTEKGSVYLSASNISNNQDGKVEWAGLLDSMRITQPGDFAWGKKGSKLSVEEVSGGSLLVNKSLLQASNGLLLQSPKLWLSATTGRYTDSATTMYWKGARFNAGARQLSLDTLSVMPVVLRDSFMAATPYQTDYITFHSGPVVLRGLNQQLLEQDSAFIASSIRLLRPVITVYRDKRPPFRSGIPKPLPADLIKALRLPVLVSRVEFQDGLVTYTELNDKTVEEGTITLNHMNAVIGNIRSRGLRPADSLLLQVDALLMDSAKLSLWMKQSYTDSLAGFRMNLRMTPTSLSFLNPVVAPLTSVNIRSGTVDSLRLQAIGNNYMALGEMHLFYRNLRIKFVNVGDNKRPKILLGTMSALANLIIRKNNNGRKSLMYFERMQDRSFFNYVVKMAFNGLAAGVGVKKNKKALRQYRKDLEQLNLPYLENEASMEQLVDAEKGNK